MARFTSKRAAVSDFDSIRSEIRAWREASSKEGDGGRVKSALRLMARFAHEKFNSAQSSADCGPVCLASCDACS
jgi:hypothetical protein